MLSDVFSGPWANVVGLLVGLLGIALSVFFYIKSRRVKKINYIFKSFNLINENVSSLPSFAAQYKGQNLKHLIATKALIWNSGTEIISLSDIAQSEPLRICIESEGEILDIKTTLMSSAANLIEISDVSEKVKTVNFDYIAPKEGFCLSVLHTAPKEESLLFKGIIKGGGAPMIFKKTFFSKHLENFSVVIIVPFVIGTVAMFNLSWQKWLFGSLSAITSMFILALVSVKLDEMSGSNLDKSFENDFKSSDFM